MSDFHEMATYLRMRKERFLAAENPAHGIDKGRRRSGIEKRQFRNSRGKPEISTDFARRTISENPSNFRGALNFLKRLHKSINKIFCPLIRKHSKSESPSRIARRAACN